MEVRTRRSAGRSPGVVGVRDVKLEVSDSLLPGVFRCHLDLCLIAVDRTALSNQTCTTSGGSSGCAIQITQTAA
jgi:hypothetical protein